jgi:hypothetical protein
VALRSDTLASVLTERPARVRLLGVSRMVPLNSTAFVAVTGNGLTVTEDLARRFNLCQLDARCEDPEQRPFGAGFLERIERQRAALLAAGLTIWRFGRQNAASLRRGKSLGSFEVWARWCRDPLLALGCQDPVERIEVLKANDPRRQRIAELFEAWWGQHGSSPQKVNQLAEVVIRIADPPGGASSSRASGIGPIGPIGRGGLGLSVLCPTGTGGAEPLGLCVLAPVGTDGAEGLGVLSGTVGAGRLGIGPIGPIGGSGFGLPVAVPLGVNGAEPLGRSPCPAATGAADRGGVLGGTAGARRLGIPGRKTGDANTSRRILPASLAHTLLVSCLPGRSPPVNGPLQHIA